MLRNLVQILVVTVCFTFSAFSQTPGPTLTPCENSEAKAFDWQIGRWQSTDGKSIHEIKKAVDDCIIQESWKTQGKETTLALKSFDGGNHNKAGEAKWFYSWTAKGFHQLWEGRKEEGQWRFYRQWWSNGEKVWSRTYWTQISADRLERIVEQSRDDGKTWKPWVKAGFLRMTDSKQSFVLTSSPAPVAREISRDARGSSRSPGKGPLVFQQAAKALLKSSLQAEGKRLGRK